MRVHSAPNKVSGTNRRLRSRGIRAFAGIAAGLLMVSTLGTPAAFAAGAPVGLGTAGAFTVLGGQSVNNTGPSIVNAGLGVSPGTSVTGFPPGLVLGTIHAADAVALQAQSDLGIAYNDAAGRAPDANIAADIGDLTLKPGVYSASSSIGLTGTLTLDAEGDSDAVFVFQIASTLITASGSSVSLINGAQPCNVFWQVGSSATLGTSSSFVGTIMALTSISVTSGATVEGRALARNGSVTLDNNVFTSPGCDTEDTPTDTPTTTPPVIPTTDTPPTTSGTDTTGPTDTTTTAGGPNGSGPTTGSGDSAANGSGDSTGGNGSATENGSGGENGSGSDTANGAGAGTEDVGGGSELTRTGASGLNSLIGAGALLLVAGGVLIVWMRKRSSTRGSH